MKVGTQIERFRNLSKAIDELEGVPIEYSIIKYQLKPLGEYLDEKLKELDRELEAKGECEHHTNERFEENERRR